MLLKNPDRQEKRGKIFKFLRSSGNFVVETIKVVVISLAIIIPIRYFLIQPFYVRGASMEPNFYDYEYLIIDEISYRVHAPQRGDVIVIEDPSNAARFFIKRIIGLPGERVVVKDGDVYIYNQSNPEGFLLKETAYLAADVVTKGKIDVTLKDEEYYFMGDNRPASLDSRILGPIEKKEIIGRVWVRVWPFGRAQSFSTPAY